MQTAPSRSVPHSGSFGVELVGFDEAELAKFEERTGRITVSPGLPSVSVVENGLLVPLRTPREGGSAGGIYDEHGNLVGGSELTRRTPGDAPQQIDVQRFPRARTFRGRHVFLGVMLHHFGHFILETLSRCWDFESRDPEDMLVFCGADAKSWTESFFRPLGYQDRPRIHLNEPARFERIIVPSPGVTIKVGAYAGAIDAYRRIGRAYRLAGPQTDQPLYLSRSRFSREQPGKRALLLEEELEQALAAAGCRVIWPETLSPAEQLALVDQHRVIIGCQGTAMHLALFSERAHHLVYLCGASPNSNYVLQAAITGHRCTFVKATTALPEFDVGTLPTSAEPQLLDVGRIGAVVQELTGIRIGHFSPLDEHFALAERAVLHARLRFVRKRRSSADLAAVSRAIATRFPDDAALGKDLARTRAITRRRGLVGFTSRIASFFGTRRD